ncbi:unnamed protein product, partial [Ectocarpus sp. 12 AP-2014]
MIFTPVLCTSSTGLLIKIRMIHSAREKKYSPRNHSRTHMTITPFSSKLDLLECSIIATNITITTAATTTTTKMAAASPDNHTATKHKLQLWKQQQDDNDTNNKTTTTPTTISV